jgi:alkylhydroperoxidase family enzyme
VSFLGEPATSDAQQAMYDANIADDGFVWDNTRLWAHDPALNSAFGAALSAAGKASGLTLREKAMLVIGQAKAIGDSFCSLAWSRWLSEAGHTDVAVAVLQNDVAPLDERERVLAKWAVAVARDPNGTTAADVDELRSVGFSDPQIFALTLFTSLRLAMSATNDALGARPDLALAEMLDPAIREAVTWGRQPA